jgi:hypothetical protein
VPARHPGRMKMPDHIALYPRVQNGQELRSPVVV